ncbi:GGDEF domain-containing protein [Vibrio kasasachensis]|uniref:GGDEF domain-containing protein n=1 Tax=Vibrio kasasachensis TaxID=2910248 RepID=UPI003D0A2EEE
MWDGTAPIGWIACDNLLSSAPLEASQINALKMLGFIVSQNIYQEQLISANNELEVKNKELEYLTAKLEELVFIDPLTKIFNRRALERYLNKEWALEKSRNSSLSVLMIDLDNFKSINDMVGHLEGDQCLKSVAQLLNHLIDEENFILARYGGEEFILSFVDITQDRLEYIAKQILSHVKKLAASLASNQLEMPLTVSIGGAFTLAEHGIGYIELIQHADKALYKAKGQGKDQFLMPETPLVLLSDAHDCDPAFPLRFLGLQRIFILIHKRKALSKRKGLQIISQKMSRFL